MRDCRKSQIMAILAISHVMKSITYKHQIHRFRVFRQSLRNYQLSFEMKLLPIPNGYLQLIASLVLVSNHGSDKGGFEAIKRANP